MTPPGFYIRRLEALGKSKEVASLDFTVGLNVISGASDTGKSYLVDCIDFLLGASTPPKEIDEARGYEVVRLELETWAGQAFLLERSLRGGDIRCYEGRLRDVELPEPLILKRKHGSDGQSASEFLLKLAELDDVRIRTNAQGKTRSTTFRDVAHLILVKEEQIYSTGSPMHPTGQYTLKTAESSLFRFFLTGVDDSTVISHESDKNARSRRQAQIEAIDELIRKSLESLSQLTDAPHELPDRVNRIDATLEQMTRTISLDRQRLQEQQRARQTLWKDVQRRAARNEVLGRLRNRFQLLDEHYQSDLRRLAAIGEAASNLDDLPQASCPLCGATGSLNQHLHANEPALAALSSAASSEIAKIQMMRADLQSTINDLQNETVQLERANLRDERSYERVVQLIDNELQPAEDIARDQFQQLLSARAELERASGIVEQMELLRTERDRIAATVPAGGRDATTEATATKTSESSSFCQVVEDVLTSWNFPGVGRVTFSEQNEDIVISGQDRKSHGKGIRALAYSAFILSLLKYCRDQKRPHPGFVILDSPLMAYREPDTAQEVARLDVKGAFFRALAKWNEHMQVIVFENEDPPSLADAVKLTHFSKTLAENTRYGFFPVPPAQAEKNDTHDAES